MDMNFGNIHQQPTQLENRRRQEIFGKELIKSQDQPEPIKKKGHDRRDFYLTLENISSVLFPLVFRREKS